MDNRIANDMISSGMIPSGKKNKEDLSRTQYGSAPSPSKLMDAYKSMYGNKEEVINEHHKKDADGNTIPHEGEELNELKTRTMLNYIDKASDSASKQLDKANKTTSRKKEVKARLKMDSRERGIEMAKDKIMKRVTEEVDKFDIVFNHFISEGCSEKEAYAKMANLTEEQLEEFITALTKKVATGAAQYGASLGRKKGDTTLATKQGPVANVRMQQNPPKPSPKYDSPAVTPGTVGFKASSPSEVVSDVHARERQKKKQATQQAMDRVVTRRNIKKEFGKKDVEEGVDMFDIALNHFLNEGYQREDIIKAMSSLNEEPISLAVLGGLLAKGGAMAAKGAAVAGKAAMGAAKAGAGAMKGAMKGVVSAAKPVTKTVSKVATKIKKDPMGAIDNVRRVTDTVDSAKNLITPTNQDIKKKPAAGQVSTGSNVYSSADLFDIVKGQLLDEGMSEEEIKDIMLTLTPDEILNELSGDLLKRAAIKAGDERGKLASQGDREGAVKKLDQQKKFSDAMKSKNLEKSRAENMRKPTQYDRPVSRPQPDPTKPYPGTPR